MGGYARKREKKGNQALFLQEKKKDDSYKERTKERAVLNSPRYSTV